MKHLKLPDSLIERYQVVSTADGSETLIDLLIKEKMHSDAGALSETDYIYLEGCQIADRLKQNSIVTVLEVGTGYGLGLERLLTFISTSAYHGKLHYIGLELNRELALFALNRLGLSCFENNGEFYVRSPSFEIRVLVGDARESVLKLSSTKVDAIFQDPFSPEKAPELWSVEWFTSLFKMADIHTVLTTYSASSKVRKSLLSAGWGIEDLQGHGNKRVSTRARIGMKTSDEIIAKLERSPVLAIHDLK